MKRALFFAALLSVAGCTGSPVPAPDLASVSDATWLSITDEGVGAVRSGTPYAQEALAGVAPGADIRSIQTAKETGTAWTHAAFINDTQAVQFFKAGKTVGEIHGVSQHLTGPNGERIGMTMAQARVARRDCRNGTKLWRGMAVCRAKNSKHVKLIFSIPGFQGPFDRLPSAEALKEAELQRIVWHAKA